MRRSGLKIRSATVGFLVLTAFALPARCETADEIMRLDDDLKISLWDCSTSMRGGLGYKDNVLLSHTNTQDSAYWMSGAEFMAFRLPTDGWQFNFFADGTDVRYFDASSVNSEQMALAAAQLSKAFDSGWKTTVGLTYLFQNEVYDNSANYYSNYTSVGLIRGHTLTPRWAWRITAGSYWAEAEFSGARQWLDAPLDSYWQFGPRAAVGYVREHAFEVALSYQFQQLYYDNRPLVNSAGEVVTNSLLTLDTHRVEMTLTQYWDEGDRWRSVTATGFETCLDNGSGFYDYDYYWISERLRYRKDPWEITLQATGGYYDYANQTVSVSDSDLRRKTMINLVLRAERKLTKHLLTFASYGWDRSISNLDFDDYQASTLMGGMALTF